MREKMEQMQDEVNEFMEYVKQELARGIGDWEQRFEHGPGEVVARRARAIDAVPASNRAAAAASAAEAPSRKRT